jgi:hypothetical protein
MPEPRLTGRELQAQVPPDWRVLSDDVVAWFGARSYAEGAALVARMADLAHGDRAEPWFDLRADGLQVRLRRTDPGFSADDVETARAISAAAAALGMAADPAGVQSLQLTIDVRDLETVRSFWREALGYVDKGEEDLLDPGGRFPPIWFQGSDETRPERNRLHVDASRRHELGRAAREAVLAGGASERLAVGYYSTMADAEGNEVDLVPLAEADTFDEPGAEDWRLIFGAMVCYPTTSASQAAELASGVAVLADETGAPVLIDIRPDGVTIDSGKDRWEEEESFFGFATRVQRLARGLGLAADLDRVRFMQVGVDAVDVAAVREFWRAALGYVEDARAEVTDIVDPRWLGPPLFFQPMPADEAARRAQRNRIHVDLYVPEDQAPDRVQAALAAGGRLVTDAHAPFWWTIADPEGNELDIAVTVGREEHWRAGEQL